MAKYNVESIMDKLKQQKTNIETFRKIDGITMECVMKETVTEKQMDEQIKEIKSICKELKLPSCVTDKHKFQENIFALQFPDLEPNYTEKEMETMIKADLKYTLDVSFYNDIRNKLTMTDFYNRKDKLVTDLLTTYYRFCINQYKHTEKEIITNKELREQVLNWINELFKDYTPIKERVVIKDDKIQ